jgi:hypothetical protein
METREHTPLGLAAKKAGLPDEAYTTSRARTTRDAAAGIGRRAH